MADHSIAVPLYEDYQKVHLVILLSSFLQYNNFFRRNFIKSLLCM